MHAVLRTVLGLFPFVQDIEKVSALMIATAAGRLDKAVEMTNLEVPSKVAVLEVQIMKQHSLGEGHFGKLALFAPLSGIYCHILRKRPIDQGLHASTESKLMTSAISCSIAMNDSAFIVS